MRLSPRVPIFCIAPACVALGATVALLGIALDARAAPPWVDRPLTLPAGDFAFDFGLGLSHVPVGPPPGLPPDAPGLDGSTSAGVNAEMAVGLTSRIELGVRTGIRFDDEFHRSTNADAYGRLFDRETFDEGANTVANPEIRIRGAIVRGPIAEVGLEGRVVLPFADGTGAGLLFGVPLAFHLGDRVRLDTGAYVPVVSPPRANAAFAVSLPLDVWIQATSRFWLGPMTGFEFTNFSGGGGVFTALSLGMGLGYEITHAIDFKAEFLFPELNQDSRVFGFGAGVQVRIE
jgi:hypothetical protein